MGKKKKVNAKKKKPHPVGKTKVVGKELMV